jgi:hypothetical protein
VTRSTAKPLRQFIVPFIDCGAALSRHRDRLDQARIVVLNIADPWLTGQHVISSAE